MCNLLEVKSEFPVTCANGHRIMQNNEAPFRGDQK